ncbi:MAG: Arc family DNA-binding protein [Armatimonadetes bacterium]|nr:Arc family DNA-binding protein [Armatimonadota bacterium]
MVRLTIRLPDELHEKLRWKCFRERRSQQVVLLEILDQALADVQVPEEKEK